nr:sigma 54-interacting transcriptional regulator [Bradyrhizobium brasilense]
MFGYEGGAFTGARSRGKLGNFELASGGTLFLDEIGDMPLHLQGSLLRVLQTNEMVPVGGTAPVAVNARVVCATNQSLPELARAGRFRPDLYYRLSVLPISVPSLRERNDIEFSRARIAHPDWGAVGQRNEEPTAKRVGVAGRL